MKAPRDPRGAALLDVLVTCVVVSIVAAMALPSLQASRERDAAQMAARQLANHLQMMRVEALRRNRAVAVRFDPDDLGQHAAYVDGDGDGVLQSDIDGGIDVAIGEVAHVSRSFSSVSLRIAWTMTAPDGAGVVAADSDPVRIGNTNLVSFSPVGSSTSGSIYVAGRDGTQLCVRLMGATGRTRVLWFDRGTAAWRQD